MMMLRRLNRGLAAGIAAGVVAGVLAACGSAGSPAGTAASSPPAGGTASSPAQAAAFNAADVAFARSMMVLDSHSEAMARLAAGQGMSPALRQFAARAGNQARGEGGRLRGWLRGWHQSIPQPWSAGPGGAYPMGPGMMGSFWGEMSRGWYVMRGLRGQGFDTGWVAMMGQGYAAQIGLAQRELAAGVSPGARGLASAVLASRQAGLTQMRRWYQDWGGPGGTGPGRDWWDRWHTGCGCW